jgi:single-stranded DNA-binding protein
MTEASVSFAGNLTDDPEVRYTEGGIARLGVRSECTWHAASRATPSPRPSPSGSVVSSPSP